VTRLRGLVPGLRHPVWTPHVTLARRLPRRRLPDALAALEERPVTRPLVADRLRWWDPTLRRVETVVGEVGPTDDGPTP
jgi:hypothetical protein